KFYLVDETHLESLQAESRRLAEEIDRLEKEKEHEPDRLASMRKVKVSLQADIQKYQNYLTDLESHSAMLGQRVNSITEDLETIELEFEAMKQEHLSLKNILDNQKYSVADIERIKYEENELQQTINKLTKDLDEDKRHLWSEELKYAKGKESVETQLAEFHKVARKLRLIPSNAQNANGFDFQIQCNLDSEQGSSAPNRSMINASLVEILRHLEGQMATLQAKKIREDMMDRLNSLRAEKKNDVKILNNESQKLDEGYQLRAEEAEADQKKWTAEIESLTKHQQVLESGVNKSLDEAMKELQEVKQQLQLAEHQSEEEMRQVGNKLSRVLHAVATHIEIIEKYLDETLLKVERHFEEFTQEDLLVDLREVLEKYNNKAESLNPPQN
ncbi:hypothetical protein FKM82_010005, partial [Ascaphus truei]